MGNDVDLRDLPNDLIQKIGDIFLSTDDLDYYTSFRAVCSCWCRATRAPKFQPVKWIILEHSLSDVGEGGVTLLNLITARCLRKKISGIICR
jgi:hypothetical protein